MKLHYLFFTTGLLATLSGCKDGNENITEISRKETQGQLQEEREASRLRTLELEADLEKRQNFYQSVAGTYEGNLHGPAGTFRIRIKLVPSLPYYKPSRVRLPEEVVHDLSNLFFNAQIHQWKDGDTLGAVGCRALGITPDMETGKIMISSADCPNFYAFQIADQTSSTLDQAGRDQTSHILAARLREGDRNPIQLIVGEVDPTSSHNVYTFSAERL